MDVEIPVGWGKVVTQVFGDSKCASNTPIIALHGYLDNSNSYKPVAPYLTDNQPYYLIGVDLPGMGFSSKIPEGIPYSLKFYLMALRRVVVHFGIKKFLLIAHSFGGSIAMTVRSILF